MHLGIDLGTSNSAVAGVADGKIRIFKTPEGTDVMPSVVYRDRRGNQTVGVRAYDQATLAPDNAVDGFKRLMGTDTALRFASTGQSITPEQAAAEVLKALVGQALVEAGTPSVTGAVVTIPAAFSQVQSEATLSAARAAGLGNVALLQEPVAAALASMAGAKDRNGLFLVYDLGGGTFDAALVHAIEGEVAVLAHEGVNMLGGRDLDRRMVDTVAVPWLRRTFDLPPNFAVDPRYTRLVRMARRAAEVAKVALSTRMQASISASDDEIRLDDLAGNPIYLDAPVSRTEFEEMSSEVISRSVACCREMLKVVGYRNEDIARIVLVGGPTKMPFLRRRVQEELGIEVEDSARVDPMTAVAAGAAIYSESRDWSASASTAKKSRQSETQGQTAEISWEYESRTAADKALLTVRLVRGGAAEVLVESLLGWSSGRRKLDGPVAFELPLKDTGNNRFRAIVFDAGGRPILDASREIAVDRLIASTGGVPATHHIATKISDGSGAERLDIIVRKGDLLPATGVAPYRLTHPLKAGDPTKLRVELYQVNDERVREPHLNLFIGYFEVAGSDLPASSALRIGDTIRLHWAMREGQGIAVEVELPSVQQHFGSEKFYNWQLARRNYSGEDGSKLAFADLDTAEKELELAEEALPPAGASQLPRLRQRLDSQTAALRGSVDPDARKQVVEEVRLLRQEIAVACQNPEARRQVQRQKFQRQRFFYDRDVRAGATPDQVARYDQLSGLTEAVMERAGPAEHTLVSDQIDEMIRLYWVHGFDQDSFCAAQFRMEREKRHTASDPAEFSRLVAEGDRALEAGDAAALKRAYLGILMGQLSMGGGMLELQRASLMRA